MVFEFKGYEVHVLVTGGLVQMALFPVGKPDKAVGQDFNRDDVKGLPEKWTDSYKSELLAPLIAKVA